MSEHIRLSAKKYAALDGRYVRAVQRRTGQVVVWASHVDGKVLRGIYAEVAHLGLTKSPRRPIIVFGRVSLVSDVGTWRFEQVMGGTNGITVAEDAS